MAGGLLMTESLLFPFHSTALGFRVWILQQLILHNNSTSDNLYETKIFTRNSSCILKNHLRNPVWIFFSGFIVLRRSAETVFSFIESSNHNDLISSGFCEHYC